MSADPTVRKFYLVYVGGPMNGLIEDSETTFALGKAPDGREIGQEIRRLMPWYFAHMNKASVSLAEARRLHDLAGVEPWGIPVYVLEATSDPDVYRFRFVHDDDPGRHDTPLPE